MIGITKSIFISIIVTATFLILANLTFFIPWYMTLVYETFNLSQAAAIDNYVKETVLNDTQERLELKPIFNQNPDQIKIVATTGEDDERYYTLNNFLDIDKPYKQRGESITVSISASYPLRFKFAGVELKKDIPITFSVKTTGLKYYKDLDLYRDVL